MEKYEKYKDSGIEWIGDIPEHWEVKKLKYVGDAMNGMIYSPSDIVSTNGIMVLRSSNIQNGKVCLNDTVYINKSIPEKLITKNGDILICSRNGSRALIGKNITIDDNTAGETFGAFMTIFRTNQYRFISKYFNSQVFSGQSGLFLTATINQLTINTLNDFYIALPPIQEQIAIADYLDKKTEEIDSLISEKEGLLKLYEEEKSAIINQAVTKGVDSGVDFKYSGIEWLGDIPEHWDVKKLKYVLSERLKYGANESALYENINDPRYIRITDFGNDGKLKVDTFKSLPFELSEDFMLDDGDILFARSGATVGKTFQFKNYNGVACFAGYLIKASPSINIILSDFLYNYTKSSFYNYWKDSIFNKATIQNIGADKYALLYIPIPPLKEQKEIVKHIEAETSRIDEKVRIAKDLIGLLKEYKKSLISEVVTGKLKVI